MQRGCSSINNRFQAPLAESRSLGTDADIYIYISLSENHMEDSTDSTSYNTHGTLNCWRV